MPTGYTAGIADGSIDTFDKFALTCARGFGALIMMRDDPLDAPIPEKFEASPYYSDRLVQIRAEIARLEAMTKREAHEAAAADFGASVEQRNTRNAERLAQKARYEAILAKVEAWTPPTPDHAELKSFMAKQLVESIDFDCSEPDPRWDPRPILKAGEAWRAEKLADLKRQEVAAEESLASEAKKAAKRTQWVNDLRASLTT